MKNRFKKEYAFAFCGTKEAFLESLRSFSNENYIVKVADDEIRFGVERGGHSGGYWFVPAITEADGRMELRGTVRYIGPHDDRSRLEKIFDTIGTVLLCILLFPIFLVLELYTVIERCVRKLFKRPQPRTTEEKLYDLMENHLHCVRL